MYTGDYSKKSEVPGNKINDLPGAIWIPRYYNIYRNSNGKNQVTRFDRIWLEVDYPYQDYNAGDPYTSYILSSRTYLQVENLIRRLYPKYIRGSMTASRVTIKPASVGNPIWYCVLMNGGWQYVSSFTCYYANDDFVTLSQAEYRAPEWRFTILAPEDRTDKHSAEQMLWIYFPKNQRGSANNVKEDYQIIRNPKCLPWSLGRHDQQIPFLYPGMKSFIKFQNVSYIGFDVTFSMYRK